MKNIYLVRHAQSQSNVNPFELHRTPNPSIQLTPTGLEQIQQTAEFFKKTLTNDDVVVWNSPYQRTRQTAKVIKDLLKTFITFKEKESIYLSERQFGLVDDVKNYRHQYLDEVNHYKLHVETKTEFFVRPPLGESPFDMCIRVDTFLKNDIENSKQENHIVVSHGAAIRGMLMMALNWEFEKYGTEPNPNNASVILLTLNDDKEWEFGGYVFKPDAQTK